MRFVLNITSVPNLLEVSISLLGWLMRSFASFFICFPFSFCLMRFGSPRLSGEQTVARGTSEPEENASTIPGKRETEGGKRNGDLQRRYPSATVRRHLSVGRQSPAFRVADSFNQLI